VPFIFDTPPRMNIGFKPLLACLLAGFITGCNTPRQPTQPIDQETTKAVEVTTKQQKAAEKAFDDRVKALARFAAGLSSQHKQEHDDALDHFFKSIKADPSNQALALTVARRLLQKQKVDDAIEVLEKVRRTKNSPGTIDALLGVAYRQKKELEKAAEASETAIQKSPGFILGYRTLFQIHTAAREPAAALAVLKRAAAIKKPATIFLIEIAELLTAHLRAHPDGLDAERPTLLDLVKRIEARNSKLPLVLERLAQMYEFAGNAKKAESILNGLVARNPNGAKFRQDLFNLYLRTNNRPAAIRQLEGLLALQPTNADYNYFRGALAAEEEAWDDAVNYYGKALQFNEQHNRAYFALAGVHLSRDDADAALGVLARARKKFKATFSLEYYSALAYSRKKDFGKSVRHYTAAEIVAKQDDPARLDHLFYFQMGATYERNKDFAKAAQVFRKVLTMKPDFPDAMNYLGYMWAERGENLPEALAMIQKAVAAEPENAAFLDSMGWALYMSGKQRESIPWLLRAVELSDEATEEDPTLFEHLGDAYFAIGDYRNARIQFQKAVKIEAKPDIKRKLAESIRLLAP
jgi:tetratricopeptide (TPR) repeat protein